MMLRNSRIELIRSRIEENLFPDTYRLIPYSRSYDGSGRPSWSEGTPVEYKGYVDIPCRIDESRHYRKGDLYGQETVINEFEIFVPYDAPLKADHIIRISARGEGDRDFEMRKLSTAGGSNTYKSALVAEILHGSDYD